MKHGVWSYFYITAIIYQNKGQRRTTYAPNGIICQQKGTKMTNRQLASAVLQLSPININFI